MSRGRVRIEQGHKRIRTYVGGELIADTTKPTLVWEKPFYPVYYFPADDVRTELLTATETTRRSPSRATAQFFAVKGGKTRDAAYSYQETEIEEIRDHYAFVWNAMDAWFEEDEEVHVHARDPFTRVDALRSSRHVEVAINGVIVADSHNPTLLFETGLPTRYYLPKTDVRLDLLTPTETATQCPYKGTARYWSVEANGTHFKDYAWSYPFPAAESAKIAGLIAFYDEKVDVTIDGVPQDRPKSLFS